MNIHTRLVGALDGAILALSALLMIALLLALIDPLAESGRSARPEQPTVAVMEHRIAFAASRERDPPTP